MGARVSSSAQALGLDGASLAVGQKKGKSMICKCGKPGEWADGFVNGVEQFLCQDCHEKEVDNDFWAILAPQQPTPDPRFIVGTPEWLEVQKKRPRRYRKCKDCGKRTNLEIMLLVDNDYYVCGSCARQYRD